MILIKYRILFNNIVHDANDFLAVFYYQDDETTLNVIMEQV